MKTTFWIAIAAMTVSLAKDSIFVAAMFLAVSVLVNIFIVERHQ